MVSNECSMRRDRSTPSKKSSIQVPPGCYRGDRPVCTLILDSQTRAEMRPMVDDQERASLDPFEEISFVLKQLQDRNEGNLVMKKLDCFAPCKQ